MIVRAQRPLFWTLGATLYLVPILLLSLQVEGYLLPACSLLYALVGWLAVGRLWPQPQDVPPPLEPEPVKPARHVEQEEMERALVALESAQRNVVQQRAMIQKKDQRIAELEGRVEDLSYEIRNLLHLEGEGPPPLDHPEEEPLRSSYDAYLLLQRCIQRAQTLSGVEVEPGLQPPKELFDAFRRERRAIVLLYAPGERRLLFANDVVEAACGFDPGSFAKQFDAIVRGGRERWEAAVRGLGVGQEASVRLLLATRSGQSLTVDACLGVIPSGPFRGLVVAVLYRE